MIKITVFTPTYNRAYILHELYDSLCKQTNKDFEWLIIDDGSIDDTENLIANWIREEKIDIRYYKVNNGGKSRAINKGVSLAKGELFFIVDSDDYLVNDAIETVLYYWAGIADKSAYSGVCGRKISSDGKLLGEIEMPFEIIDTDNLSLHYKYGLNVDMAEVFRSDLLRLYKFPDILGEKFVPEAFIWNKITGLYPMRYFDKGIYVCEYLPDGYTKNFMNNLKRNPCGFRLYYSSVLRSNCGIPMSLRVKFLFRVCQCLYFQILKLI